MASTAYVVVTVLAAVANASAATLDFRESKWVLGNMERLGVPRSGLSALGALKAAGAAGLLVGFAVPLIGVAAAIGLCLFFTGAVVTTIRAGWYAHLPYPGGYLLLAAASLGLALAAA